jgi:hypothetical protein
MTVTVPDKGQCRTLLLAFQRGERLTVAEALSNYGCFALSQRCGELRRSGWPVMSEWYETPNGARVKRYYMEA